MTCDDAKALMMGALYGEMEEGEEEQLTSHLSSCQACSEELAGLRQTSRLLRVWKDVDPELHLRFIEERPSRLAALKRLMPLPRWAGVSVGLAAAALFLMALLNLEVSYRDGAFDLRVSLLPRPQTIATPALEDTLDANRYVTPEMLARVQEENFRLMQQLIEASEARQMEFVTTSLSQFAAEVEAQRQRDLRLVDRGLEAVQITTERQFLETHQILGDLIRLAQTNYGEPENR
jgi:hypothetical protein